MKLNKQLIKKFCSPDTENELHSPWLHEGHLCATDGCILIQVDASNAETEGVGTERKRDFTHVMKDFHAEDMMDIPKLATEECHLCENGQCSCEWCGTIHPCGMCEGTGRKIANTKIGERLISGEYLRKIAMLPMPQINPKGDKLSPMPFRFYGGIGLVMPLKFPV